jgi:hypothetical protein
MVWLNSNLYKLSFYIGLIIFIVCPARATTAIDIDLPTQNGDFGSILGLAYNPGTDQFYITHSSHNPPARGLIYTLESDGSIASQWDIANLVPISYPLSIDLGSISFDAVNNHLFIGAGYEKSRNGFQSHLFETSIDGATLFRDISSLGIDGYVSDSGILESLYNTETINQYTKTGQLISSLDVSELFHGSGPEGLAPSFSGGLFIVHIDGIREVGDIGIIEIDQNGKPLRFISTKTLGSFGRPSAIATDMSTNRLFVVIENNEIYTLTESDQKALEAPLPALLPFTCDLGTDPQVIKKGQRSGLWWWTQGTLSSPVINNGIGQVPEFGGSISIYPSETTNYTMTIEDEEGNKTTCETTIKVEDETVITPLPLCDIGADPHLIKAGERTSLWWWTQDALSPSTIDGGVGEVNEGEGYKWVYPSKTTSYRMTVKNKRGDKVSCKTTVKVEGAIEPAVPQCDIGADPKTIKAGEKVPLWWWTQDAEFPPVIDNDIGEVKNEGYKWVYPTETITYTMTVEDGKKTKGTCETTIVVEGEIEPIPPLCTIGTDPQIIKAGNETSLWWWFQNDDKETTAVIDSFIGPVGSYQQGIWIQPSETITYTMTVEDGGGSKGTCSTTVLVDDE